MLTARVIEVFSSLQGEGIYAGRPHLFVRFWNCNLACRYCDTDYRGPYRESSLSELLAEVRRQVDSAGPFHAVSLTGGEPLLWWRFLKEWLPRLKALGQRAYLETNGTLTDPLREILPWIDIVAMDLKPPSATGDRPLWEEHEAFLRAGVEAGRDLFVKVVVTAETADDEVRQAVDLVGRVDRGIPFVLQPVTPWGPVREGPEEQQLGRWRSWAAGRLADVRVIPQMHRIWGVP
ncbi:MAG: 7-carboxy-7-deazaguanine synthase QueE [Candidatus Omnitrophica bacterium]|nr:7-carboxy-7-deazaguanine synthase QueE [Candidatus Omnitrophota bacterium]